MIRFVPSIIKNKIKYYLTRKKYGKLVFSYKVDQSASIALTAKISPNVSIRSNVHIGENCYIAPDVDLRKNVIVGDNSYINNGTLVASGTIGKFCSIGYNCQIGIFEHPTNLISTSPSIYRHKNLSQEAKPNWSGDDINSPPIIGNDVWIGSDVICLQGVKVGDGAILSAGCVVTKDVAPYSIVGGIPAKEIKKRFSENDISILIDFKWWDKSDDWISNNIDLFMNTKHFISVADRHNKLNKENISDVDK